MRLIKFDPANSEQLFKEWNGNWVAWDVKLVVCSIVGWLNSIGECEGCIITSLVRSRAKNTAVGGVPGSLHVPQNSPSGKCEACDLVLLSDHPFGDIDIADFCAFIKNHFRYVDVVYHKVKGGQHFHIECDTKSKELQVEIY